MDKYRDQIFSYISALLGKTPASANVGSSSRLAPEPVVFQAPLQLNDYVYEVYKPGGRRPSVEIVFFHGLQLEHLSSKDVHITTWLSEDELWLKWLCDDNHFPNARILTIFYPDSEMDMYCTCENLVHSITASAVKIGQAGCPVVLVGHSLGGSVMKSLCIQANSMLSEQKNPNEALDNLLERVAGFFFYACPHHGSRLPERKPEFGKDPLFKDWRPLNKSTERENESFRKLRLKYGWKTFGIGEIKEATLKGFTGIVVEEASARHDMDEFYTVAADHIGTSRPRDRQANSFQLLVTFVSRVLKEDKGIQVGLLAGPDIVGLEDSVKIVQEELCEARRLAIVGMGGIGKSTLAKAVFDKISHSFDYTCFFEEVKKQMDSEENSNKLRNLIAMKLKDNGRDLKSSFKWENLKGMDVLIILDDVTFASQVMVMTESDGFSQESRVIVTSRETGFLRDFNLHMVRGLNEDDSKRLFCLHAFGVRVAPPNFEERVTRFAKKCDGLPLALKVSGRYLYKKGKNAAWDDALEDLRNAQSLNGNREDGLWSVLRVSYDSLDKTREQQMFLDVATCFHGEDLKQVQNAWRACSWAKEVQSGWENLVDRCLVSRDTEGRISMHEVLRDLGRKIAGRTRVNVFRRDNGSFSSRIQEAIQLRGGQAEGTEVLMQEEGNEAGLLAGLEIVGLERIVQNVQKKLSGTQRLGIVGMSGIGKTTLAKAVFDKISWNFEYTCFFDDVKHEMESEENINKLRAKILTRLKNRSGHVNRSLKWKTLKGKSVLIVLDNVKFESHVMVMTESDGFSQESRVIVTSRESRFLQDFHLHMIERLNPDDSERLFCLHALRGGVAPRDFEVFEMIALYYCRGLPLALKVLGRYLYKQGQTATWIVVFHKLSKPQMQAMHWSVEDGLWSILSMIYGSLANREQQMFLDVATCFHGEDLKAVQDAWRCDESSGLDKSVWQNLVDMCLVSRDTEGRILMHEMLRDFGRAIAGDSRVIIDDIERSIVGNSRATIGDLEQSIAGTSQITIERSREGNSRVTIRRRPCFAVATEEAVAIEETIQLSLQDETGAPAIKTLELDAALGRRVVQYRESQGHKTDLFLSYFKPCVITLEGGIKSGFRKVEAEAYQTGLFMCRGACATTVTQVPFARQPFIQQSLNDDDLFI